MRCSDVARIANAEDISPGDFVIRSYKKGQPEWWQVDDVKRTRRFIEVVWYGFAPRCSSLWTSDTRVVIATDDDELACRDCGGPLNAPDAVCPCAICPVCLEFPPCRCERYEAHLEAKGLRF